MFSFSGILRKMEVAEVQTIDIEIVGEHARAVDVLANMWSFTDSEVSLFHLLSDENSAPWSFTSFLSSFFDGIVSDVMPDLVKTCETPRRGVFLLCYPPQIMQMIISNVHSGGNPAP
ncbi:hypothetical protein Y032_0790g2367 [Ancylostoma ceylanicum]|uniref:Uncharacterized protein n=1 Tax=Ancylostoma ceylanicum TaxID=53326 RepID=A0A016WC93_9BILA|nr:hypothetical protein Y032_0790g2367 [Ancylostoma ceylanicum]